MSIIAIAVQTNVNPKAKKIIDTCEEFFDEYHGFCNKFVIAVAKELNISLSGFADEIVDQVLGDGWSRCANGVEAKAKADDGFLVIGGLKGKDQSLPVANGHVVIVVSGPLAHEKYPSAYWGKLEGTGEKNKTVNYAWKTNDRDNVIYSARQI